MNVDHEGVTRENSVHGTDRALEVIRTRRETRSPLKGNGEGLGMWLRAVFASEHRVLEFKAWYC